MCVWTREFCGSFDFFFHCCHPLICLIFVLHFFSLRFFTVAVCIFVMWCKTSCQETSKIHFAHNKNNVHYIFAIFIAFKVVMWYVRSIAIYRPRLLLWLCACPSDDALSLVSFDMTQKWENEKKEKKIAITQIQMIEIGRARIKFLKVFCSYRPLIVLWSAVHV